MSYTEKLILKNKLKFYSLLLVLVFITGISGWFSYSNYDNSKLVLLITGLFYFFLGFLAFPLYKKIKNKIDYIEDDLINNLEKAKKGDDGEKKVFQKLEEILDSSKYFIYNNFVIPNKKFDIDTIIIGPKGIILFEIKNYSCEMIFDSENAYIIINNELNAISPYKDPRDQINRHSYALRQYLNVSDYKNYLIKKAIIFLDENSVSFYKGVKTGIYIIAGIEKIKQYIDNLPDDPLFTPEKCQKINNFLINKH